MVWFYLGKFLWPSELLFIYPHWELSRVQWWQYLFPVATVRAVPRPQQAAPLPTSSPQ